MLYKGTMDIISCEYVMVFRPIKWKWIIVHHYITWYFKTLMFQLQWLGIINVQGQGYGYGKYFMLFIFSLFFFLFLFSLFRYEEGIIIKKT